jgi:hypothetical protein
VAAINHTAEPGFEEELTENDLELAGFLGGVGDNASALGATDLELAWVLEDLAQGCAVIACCKT